MTEEKPADMASPKPKKKRKWTRTPEQERARRAKRVERAKAAGKCPVCLVRFPEPDYTTCRTCLDEQIARSKHKKQEQEEINGPGTDPTPKRPGGFY